MASDRMKCLVVGLGNRFRSDDGVGVVVAEELRKRKLPASVEVLDGGTDELGLIEGFQKADHIVVVDALSMGEPPGTIRTFFIRRTGDGPAAGSLCLHALSLADVIGLSRCLGGSLAVTVVGIEPESTVLGEALSDPIKTKITHLIDATLFAIDAACASSALTREGAFSSS